VIKVDFRPLPGAASPARPPKGVKEEMEAAALAAATELFLAYGVQLRQAAGPQPGLAALGLVKFAGDGVSGTATLGASVAILKRTNGGGNTMGDWIAELANQYIGRFKLKLLRNGFKLWSLAPVAVKGRLLVTGVTQPDSPPLTFADGQGGAVAIWMEMDVTGEIKSSPPSPPSDEPIANEGDLLLF
jgi:hypothetical protein